MLQTFNHRVCLILYFPVALVICFIFTIINIVLAPIAYLSNTGRLLSQILEFNSFQDWSRNCCILLCFVLIGPLILVVSIPINCVQLMYNLYASNSKYVHPSFKGNFQLSEEGLESYICSLKELKQQTEMRN